MNSWLSSIKGRITSYLLFILQRTNLISIIVVCLLIYKFISGLSFEIGLLSFIISFLISLAVSSFILDKFTYSENTTIRIIQRFLIYNIIILI